MPHRAAAPCHLPNQTVLCSVPALPPASSPPTAADPRGGTCHQGTWEPCGVVGTPEPLWEPRWDTVTIAVLDLLAHWEGTLAAASGHGGILAPGAAP